MLRRLKPVGFPGHWLGTDEVGRDLWSRMVYGGRLSLLCRRVPVFLALLVGGSLGILAGYAGGVVNSAIMRLDGRALRLSVDPAGDRDQPASSAPGSATRSWR